MQLMSMTDCEVRVIFLYCGLKMRIQFMPSLVPRNRVLARCPVDQTSSASRGVSRSRRHSCVGVDWHDSDRMTVDATLPRAASGDKSYVVSSDSDDGDSRAKLRPFQPRIHPKFVRKSVSHYEVIHLTNLMRTFCSTFIVPPSSPD